MFLEVAASAKDPCRNKFYISRDF